MEFFNYTFDSIIVISKLAKNYFIGATFHYPKDKIEIIFIIFKDTLNHEYFTCFYILVNNKRKEISDISFNSIKVIFAQNDVYKLLWKLSQLIIK